MSNYKRDMNDDLFDAKKFFKKYLKRILIVMLICFPILVCFNIFMGDVLQNWLIILIDICILLLATFIGAIICIHIDKKKKEKDSIVDKQKKRDPFAD